MKIWFFYQMRLSTRFEKIKWHIAQVHLGFKMFITKHACANEYLGIVYHADVKIITVMLKGNSRPHADRFRYEHQNIGVANISLSQDDAFIY